MKVYACQACCEKCVSLYGDEIKSQYGIDAEQICKDGIIDLSDKNLTSVPEWVYCFGPSVKCLKLNNNPNLGRIPYKIYKLINLQCLELQNCGIIQMPRNVFGLRRLERICANGSDVIPAPDFKFCCNHLDGTCGEQPFTVPNVVGMSVLGTTTIWSYTEEELKRCTCKSDCIQMTKVEGAVLTEAILRLDKYFKDKYSYLTGQELGDKIRYELQHSTEIYELAVFAMTGYIEKSLADKLMLYSHAIGSDIDWENNWENYVPKTDAEKAKYKNALKKLLIKKLGYDSKYLDWGKINTVSDFTKQLSNKLTATFVTCNGKSFTYATGAHKGCTIENKNGGSTSSDVLGTCWFCGVAKIMLLDLGFTSSKAFLNTPYDQLKKYNILYMNLTQSLENQEFGGLKALSGLRYLDLASNKITSIPSFITNFRHLQFLGLAYNDLIEIPFAKDLKNLEMLNLQQPFKNYWASGPKIHINMTSALPPELLDYSSSYVDPENSDLTYTNEDFNNCFIDAQHQSFSRHPHYFYKRNVKGVFTGMHYKYSDNSIEFDYNYGKTPDSVLEHLATVSNPNLIFLQINVDTYIDDAEIDKIADYIERIFAKNPNIEHFSIYGQSNVSSYKDHVYFQRRLNQLEIRKMLGTKFDQLKSFYLQHDMGLDRLSEFYTIDEIRDFYENGISNLEFYYFNTGKYFYNDSKTVFDETAKYFSKNIRYYNRSGTFEIDKRHVYDYYTPGSGEGIGYTDTIDYHLKQVITDRVNADSTYVPPKGCLYSDYLYNRFKGNLVNGYPYERWKNPPPFDVWDYNGLPIGDLND